MTMFYSPSRFGFFDHSIHDPLPEDCLELTDDEYHALLSGQAAGKCITVNEDGRPDLIERPELEDEAIAVRMRHLRDELMASFSWRIERYNREVRLGLEITDDLQVLDAYMQQLADITEQDEFPHVINWPTPP